MLRNFECYKRTKTEAPLQAARPCEEEASRHHHLLGARAEDALVGLEKDNALLTNKIDDVTMYVYIHSHSCIRFGRAGRARIIPWREIPQTCQGT